MAQKGLREKTQIVTFHQKLYGRCQTDINNCKISDLITSFFIFFIFNSKAFLSHRVRDNLSNSCLKQFYTLKVVMHTNRRTHLMRTSHIYFLNHINISYLPPFLSTLFIIYECYLMCHSAHRLFSVCCLCFL